MEYKPEKKTGKVWAVLGFLTAIALLFWLTDFLGWGFPVVNQLGLIGSAVAIILIVCRYILNDYVYAINEHGYFTVVRVYGRNRRVLADIRISAADRLVSAGEDLSRYGPIRRKENFSISIFPKSTYLYIFQSGGAVCAMVLECGEEVAARIRQAIEYYGAINDANQDESEEDDSPNDDADSGQGA